MELWLSIIAAGAATYLTRLSFIAWHGRVHPPAWFTRALAFVPIAVLSAIIFPDLFAPQGRINVSLSNAQLIAGVCAAIVAWRTQNVWLTIGLGMAILYVIKALMAL